MSKVVYYSKHGGAVLAALGSADPAYEKQLDKAGIEYQTVTLPDGVIPAADQLQKARIRPGQDNKPRLEVDN